MHLRFLSRLSPANEDTASWDQVTDSASGQAALVLFGILSDWSLATGFSEKLNLPLHLFDGANKRSKDWGAWSQCHGNSN